MFIRAGIDQKGIVFSIGLLLFVNTLSAQVSDSYAGRFFLQLNTSFRHVNMKAFNQRFSYVGLKDNKISNALELSGYAGWILGKERQGFIKLGYHYIPDINGSNSTISKHAFDSTVLTSGSIHTSRFRIQSLSVEGGYFYRLGKVSTEIGLGISYNSLRRTITRRDFSTFWQLNRDGTVFEHTHENPQGPQTEDITNRGIGGLVYGGVNYPISTHLTLSSSLRFYLAGIIIRWEDGTPIIFNWASTPFGQYREYLVANLNGVGLSAGIRYNL